MSSYYYSDKEESKLQQADEQHTIAQSRQVGRGLFYLLYPLASITTQRTDEAYCIY